MTTIGTMIEGFARISERMRGRKLLLELDERMLKDIGGSRSIAASEANKPWWRD